MKQSRLWIIIVVVLLLLNTAVLAMLWFKRPPQVPPPGGNAKDFLVKELQLTPAQQQQFDSLRRGHQQQVKDAMDGMKELKDALVEQVTKPQADAAAIDSLTKAINEKERKRETITVYHFRALRGILTPQQQARFDKILKDVLRMMSNGGGGQRPPQGPPGRGRGDRPPGDSGEMPPPGDRGPEPGGGPGGAPGEPHQPE